MEMCHAEILGWHELWTLDVMTDAEFVVLFPIFFHIVFSYWLFCAKFVIFEILIVCP